METDKSRKQITTTDVEKKNIHCQKKRGIFLSSVIKVQLFDLLLIENFWKFKTSRSRTVK